ncbi:MAG: leucine-rich repeat domain-containing protein [Lachnospiraceae bacterium]
MGHLFMKEHVAEQRWKNRIAILIFSLAVLCGFGNTMVVQAAETFVVTADSSFSCDANGIIIAYNGNKELDETVVIPQMINGVEVKGIGDNAFAGCVKLTTILIPDTLSSIGNQAFALCSSLSTMAVYQAEQINGSGQVEYEDNTMQRGVVTLPSSLSSLGEAAFLSCKSVGSFAVSQSNPSFKTGSWNPEQTDKGEMLMSKDGKVLYRFAAGFHYTGQGLYLLPEGLETISNYALEAVGLNGGFTIPTTVTTIGNYAFYECGNLNSVTFTEPSAVAVIGDYAFSKNNNLNITLPASVTTLGTYCFSECSNIVIDISKTQIVTLPVYVFYECNNLHELTTPVTLKNIEAYAFYGCDNLNTVHFLGETLDKIGTAAFQTCPNLHEIIIPSGVTTIENSTFDGCWNLNKIVLPDTVTTIGDNAFKDCRNIHEMVIPESVTYISNTSFEGAKQDEIDTTKNAYSQKFIKGVLPAKGDTFIVGDLKYKVTKSSETKGTVAVCGVNSKKIKSAVIDSTVMYKGYTFKITEIASNAFKKCIKLKNVTIGSNVTKIGKNAFSGDKNLNKLTVKSTGLKSIGANALKGISKKAVIKVPKKKYAKYKKLLKSSTGYKSTMKIKK